MSDTLDLREITMQDAEKLLKDGMSAPDLLVSLVKMSTDEYSSDTKKFEPSPTLAAKQSELVQFCINNGTSLKDVFDGVHQIPANFIENNLPLIIASQYDPTEVLSRI